MTYLKAALGIAAELGIPVAHETHRRRLLWNPWQARDLMKAVPELMVNADLSHWVCACERIFDENTSDEWLFIQFSPCA